MIQRIEKLEKDLDHVRIACVLLFLLLSCSIVGSILYHLGHARTQIKINDALLEVSDNNLELIKMLADEIYDLNVNDLQSSENLYKYSFNVTYPNGTILIYDYYKEDELK